MSIRTLYDPAEDAAVLFDSVTGFTIGPVIDGPDAAEDADGFVDWAHTEGHDLRHLGPAVIGKLIERYRSRVVG